MAISVLVAVDPVGDELIEKIKDRMARLTVGPGRLPNCEMGPLITGAHRDRVTSYLDAGLADGATLAVDGREHPVTGGDTADGFWLGPTLFDNVKPGMSVYDDEIFGPVLSVVRVASCDEVLRASGSCFGSAESTMRTDACRCTADGRILDPCFSLDSNPADTSALCLDGAPDRMVALSVAEGFPGNNNHMPDGPDIEPIIIVLANGARCSFAGGGTLMLAGQRLNHGCDNGGYLYGYPNKTTAMWTICRRQSDQCNS